MYNYQEKINKKLLICDELEKGQFPNKLTKWGDSRREWFWSCVKSHFKALHDWSVRSQLLFTLFLLAGSWLILNHMPKPDATLLSTVEKILDKLDKLAELIERNIR